MDKKFWAVVGVILVVFVGFLFINNQSESKDTKSSSSTAKPSSHVKGEGTKVTLVEYGDFQCPACSGYYSVIEQVMQKYSNDITMQFRHFPLTSIHQNAFGASRAAEAAGKQDKFWEMYSKLYTNQNVWSSSNNANSFFEAYAREIGLDVAQYKKDFLSTEVNDTIKADMETGNKLGINSTPTFIVNGKIIPLPAQSLEAFSEVIDKAIADSSKTNQ